MSAGGDLDWYLAGSSPTSEDRLTLDKGWSGTAGTEFV
jgi:hypothetical protein